MTQPVILRLDGVTKQYTSTSQPAVDRVSLTLHQGELLSLLGPSGCGKTTLLRLIAGFERTQTGQIDLTSLTVDGQGGWIPPERRDVGIVFQDYALFPHLTVYKNVAFGLKQQSRRLNDREIRLRTQNAIALVELQGLEHRYPHELSGGQQQRVALARALAPQPNLILLDEPFSNLDVEVRLYLRQKVREVLKSTGTTAVFVTHDQEEALAISDRVGVMRQGHLEQLGTPEELYQQPISRFVAGFVTQANFLPARRQGQMWQTEVGDFAVDVISQADEARQSRSVAPVHSATLPEYDGDLMIRQEDLHLELDDQGTVLIRDRQFLGREYRYCLQTPSGQELHARTPIRSPLPIGSRVCVKLANQAFQFFPYALTSPSVDQAAQLKAS
ncbi:MAG: ABC transporter ATP-binding protein [Thainema sp.]